MNVAFLPIPMTIRNLGRAPNAAIGRYWLITNGHGREELKSGRRCGWRPAAHCARRRYQYTSGAVVKRRGHHARVNYEMIDENGDAFTIGIPDDRLARTYIQLKLL